MRTSTLFVAIAFCAVAAGHASRALAQNIGHALTSFAGVALSPDGRYVVDVQSKETADPTREAAQHLLLREVSTAIVRELPLPCARFDGCSTTLPVWSHDSKTIAYVVHAPKSKTREVYVYDLTHKGALPRRLLEFAGTLGALKFAANDAKLGALAIPGARKEVGATQAGAAIVGEIGVAPDEQRIVTIDVARPTLAYASPADLFVYEYDWVPNGMGFVGTAAHGDGDNNWWVARLYRFDAATAVASELYRPASPQQQIASPRVSPDGRYVAFIGGIMSDFGSTGGDLYELALDRANPVATDLTPNAAASVTSELWMCDSDALSYTQLRGQNDEIVTLAADTASPRTLESRATTLGAGNGANVSRACETAGAPSVMLVAAVRQSFETPPEVEIATLGGGSVAWVALTNDNAGIPLEATARSVTWTSDAFSVQGWLLEPAHARATTKRALVTIVHGGPAAATTPRFVGRGTTRDLLRRGYGVFLPNPRGSFGQGEAFALANVKDFGYGDLRDILTGIDAVEKSDPTIDDARLGITGGSYGGFMTMWAVTQTQRFKAAVAGAGIANWISYYGENGIDEWMIPYFGAPAYDDAAVYRKSSPIDFIKNVKTPTFEFVGERDVECPAPQSQEFWHALVAQGVPTSLVIYAGEGHRIASAKNQADVTKRTLAWFDAYLKP